MKENSWNSPLKLFEHMFEIHISRKTQRNMRGFFLRAEKASFTLIELLIVIAIIAILAGMLLPVLNNARESAKKIQCTSNMRNIGIATMMYCSDWNEMLPPDIEEQTKSNLTVVLAQYLGMPNVKRADTTAKFFQCPSEALKYISSGTPTPGRPAINYRSTFLVDDITKVGTSCPLIGRKWGGWRKARYDFYKKLSQVADRSVLMIEMRAVQYCNYTGFQAHKSADYAKPTYTIHYLASGYLKYGANFYHNRSSNFMRMDGSIFNRKVNNIYEESYNTWIIE